MRRFRLLLGILAVFGVILSVYLLAEHYRTTGSSFCDVNATINCDVVNKSQYAELFGIPVALFGILYYLGLCLFAFAPDWLARKFADGDPQLLLVFGIAYLLFGFAFSAYLTAIEAFVLGVYCPLCVLSASDVTLSLVLTWLQWRSG